MSHKLDGRYTIYKTKVDVRVSPCSWIYPGYPFQITYRSVDKRSQGFIQDNTIHESTATKDHVKAMLAKTIQKKCQICQHDYLFDNDKHSNRQGLCEECFITKTKQQFDQEMAAERDKLLRMDEKLKKRGYTHRIDAWIHPNGGDDYQTIFYTKGKPNEKQVESILHKAGSVVLNDYQIKEI